jgi:histone H3/H4
VKARMQHQQHNTASTSRNKLRGARWDDPHLAFLNFCSEFPAFCVSPSFPPLLPAAMVKTAYFVFSEEHRQAVREQLVLERGEGAKVGVAEVAKVLGLQWKALDDAVKAEYKERAAAVNKAAAEAQAQAQEDGVHGGAQYAGEEEATEGKEASPLDGLLPISLIKKCMTQDEEVSRVSHEGVIMVAATLDALLGMLAKSAAQNAKTSKRSTLQLKDITQVGLHSQGSL